MPVEQQRRRPLPTPPAVAKVAMEDRRAAELIWHDSLKNATDIRGKNAFCTLHFRWWSLDISSNSSETAWATDLPKDIYWERDKYVRISSPK